MNSLNLWLKALRESERNVLLFVALIVMAGMLSACIPVPLPVGEYYKPSYPDNSASHTSSFISESMGKSASVLEIPTPDGSIKVDLRDHIDHLELQMSIDTSGSSIIQFTSNVIHLTDLDKGTKWAIEAGDLILNMPTRQVPYSSVVDLEKDLPAAPEYVLNDMAAMVFFSIKDFSPDDVRLHLPPISVGPEEYKISPILLEAKKESGGSMELDWWSYKLTEAKYDRFKIRTDGKVSFNGSTKIDARLRELDLSVWVTIHFPADMKWEFATNEIRVEDINTDEVRQIHFTSLQVSSATKVAFSAPFCRSKNVKMEGIAIGTVKPEKLRIEFPSLLINGEEFVIKPITYSLKKYDLGILPFNS